MGVNSPIARELLGFVSGSPSFGALHRSLRRREEAVFGLKGLRGSARSLLAALLKEELDSSVLLVCRGNGDAEEVFADLAFCGFEVELFPEYDLPDLVTGGPRPTVLDRRLSCLHGLMEDPSRIVVTTIGALRWKVPSPEELSRNVFRLRVGEEIALGELVKKLVALGYGRQALVEEKTDFCVRGGIVDFFSPGSELPVRLELEGDVVSSLREFNPESQRSVGRLEEAVVLPARELVPGEERLRRAAERLSRLAERDRQRSESLFALSARLEDQVFFEGMEALGGLYGLELGSALSYFPEDALVVLDRPPGIEEALEEWDRERDEFLEAAERELGYRPAPDELLFQPEEVFSLFSSHPVVTLHEAGEPEAAERGSSRRGALPREERVFRFDFRSQEYFARDVRLLRKRLRELSGEGFRSYILCDTPVLKERLEELLEGVEVRIEVGRLSSGFEFTEGRLSIFTEREIFARPRRRLIRKRFRRGISLAEIATLSRGDRVVHIDHGIGIYRGIKRLPVDGHETDCLEIEYARGDKLFVPVDQLDLVQKYVAEEGAAPSLDRLGGASWARLKKRAKRAIKDMARELIKLNALRKSRPGVAAPPDTEWQRELESSFIYEETPDQLKAIREIKADMEAPRPMERLVCGDVGYGKTEVALRASFKALMGGRQVAVLVPTTILAQQHYETFTERLGAFGVRVEVLSRFRSRKDQARIVEEVKAGEVDIVIGTHRLLQKDVAFKDLGLLVIDEEHRFGVAHKEKLKRLRTVVDVLTLSATPIPRTLHMALTGIRDMSVIDTPPRGRLPIQTEIHEFNGDLIAEALIREADRGGQSFVIHNRVQSIDGFAAYLQRLVPELRIAVAHGQMKERKLERIMLEFLEGAYDVLVCTMIIEAGMDMPSVNTLVVNRADRFGLSQLYQLRGRVGRSVRKAYCYLLVPPRKSLTEAAEKRLQVIEEYDELGSGFKIAMKDLEIRGAGNILGTEQHGFLVSVGFDMYCRLLEEAVAELKGEPVARAKEVRMSVALDAFLPEDYVPITHEKLTIYKRLADARTHVQVDALEEEVSDRFGKLPEPARILFELKRLRIDAENSPVEKLWLGEEGLRLELESGISRKTLLELLSRISLPVALAAGPPVRLSLRQRGARSVLEGGRMMLRQMARSDSVKSSKAEHSISGK